MRTFPFFFLLLAPVFSQAQFSIQHVRDYGETTDAYRVVRINAQGNYVLGGESGSYGVFAEIRPDGLVLQDKKLAYPHGSSTLIPLDDGYIGGVVRRFNAGSSGEASSAIIISRLDASGNGLWHKILDNSENYDGAQLAGLFIQPDQPEEVCVATARTFYRLNLENGDILSQIDLGPGLNGQYLTYLEPAGDGYKAVQFLPGTLENARMLWYDADFTVVQEKIVPRGTVTPASDGGWLVFNFWTTWGQQPALLHYKIHKLSADGNALFTQTFEYAEYEYLEGYRLNGAFEIGNEVWVPGTYLRKPFIKRLSAATGSEIDPVSLGAWADQIAGIEDILPAPNGATLLAGKTQGGENLPWQSDALFLTLAPGGSTAAASLQDARALTLYPNPADEQVYVPAGVDGRVEVYDVSGCLALQLDAVPADRAVSVRRLSAGTYVLRVVSGMGGIWVGQFSVVR